MILPLARVKMSFWNSLSDDVFNAIQQRIAENLGAAFEAAKVYRDGHDEVSSKIADLATAAFAKKLWSEDGKDLIFSHLHHKQHFNAQTMASLGMSPWIFSNDGEGLLTTAIFDSVYRNGPRYVLEAENDLNATVTESIASSMRLIYEILSRAPSDFEKPEGLQVYFAPTTKEESELGSDTLLVGHVTNSGRDLFRGVLLQGKVVTQANAYDSIARGPNDWDQLERLLATGMGFYAFYQHTNGYTQRGIPAFPITVRTASAVAHEAIEAGSLNIHSLADDAREFPSFVLDHVLSQDVRVGRCFLTAEDLFAAIASNFNIEAVLALSASGGAAFEKIQRLTESERKVDPARSPITAVPKAFARPKHGHPSETNGHDVGGGSNPKLLGQI